MNNTVAAALIALVIGLGIGIGAMALLSDDATLPLPQPLADTPKDVSNDTNNDNPKRPRPNPDKPNPIEEPTRPEPVPVDNSKPDGAYTIQAQKSDKTITGLVIGKFIGISGACWLGLRYKIGYLPDGVNIQHVIGVSLIAGIGFTMSTFIAAVGFDAQPEHLHNAKTSILVASVLSAILGVLYIRIVSTKKHNKTLNSTPKNGAN